MTRIITLALLLATLASCAAQKGEMSAPVTEPVAATAATATDACDAGDDGIGGTGCPVK